MYTGQFEHGPPIIRTVFQVMSEFLYHSNSLTTDNSNPYKWNPRTQIEVASYHKACFVCFKNCYPRVAVATL